MRNNDPPSSSARRTFDTAAANARAESRKAREAAQAPSKDSGVEVEGVREDELVALQAHTDNKSSIVPGSFDHLVGRRQVIVAGNRAKSGGFYCKVCDSVHKDSNRYLAHINGRAHLHRLGMSTRAKRATLEEVLQAFEIERRRLHGLDDIDDDDEAEEAVDEEDKRLLEAGVPLEFGSTAR